MVNDANVDRCPVIDTSQPAVTSNIGETEKNKQLICPSVAMHFSIFSLDFPFSKFPDIIVGRKAAHG